MEVWSHPDLFELDERLRPTRVSGVPPDYFAKEGQLWNNPLYDYPAHKKDNYSWWTNRLVHNLKMYDILRIDHFRGLSEYWAVKYGASNAINGTWEKGPGIALINALKKKNGEPNIVAEDLGIIDDNVVALLKESGFPGMRVLQFAFDGTKDNLHLPYNYEKNTVAYTATHDNNTTLGWLYELDEGTRRTVLDYLNVASEGWGRGGGGCISTRAAIREIIASVSRLAIIPMQDLCGYGGDTRTNVPGVADGNWEYRVTNEAMDEVDRNYLLHLNRKYGRINR